MATVIEVMRGLIMKKFEYAHDFQARPHTIARISEHRVVLSKEQQVKRYFRVSDGAFTSVDGYGATDGSDVGHRTDDVIVEDSYYLPEERRLTYVVTARQLSDMEISLKILKSNATKGGQEVIDILGKLKSKVFEMIEDAYEYRYEQTRIMFRNFNNPAAPISQRPYGFMPVALAAQRPLYFNYDNLVAGALDATTKRIMVNIFAGKQKNHKNVYIGRESIQSILHASDITLAEDFHVKSDYMANEWLPGDSFTRYKSIGLYGDDANPDNWIALGSRAEIYRRGTRIMGRDQMSSGMIVDISITDQDVAHPTSGKIFGRNSLLLVVEDNTIPICDSINGIGMGVA